METVFLELIKQLNSSVFLLFLILVITILTVYRLGIWKNKFDVHDKRVERIENMNDIVIGLKTKVDLIYQHVIPNIPTRSASPISFTPVGNEIAAKIDAPTIFVKYSEKLATEVEKRNPQNAYDIQVVSIEIAKNFMINLLDDAELLKFKEEAFNKGILLEDVMGIFGVLLRNHVLRQKGISIADIDKHDPKSKL